jgi:hypothetical protein
MDTWILVLFFQVDVAQNNKMMEQTLDLFEGFL